tara:strand:+ start:837 stop:1688 length:852 start_codon:yes stop_codon:yes gene_type:complete
MPCTECKDGLYKWGETGDCKYNTKEECDKANSYEEMNTTSIVELVIDDSEDSLAIDCISLVSAPAIEENMIFMSKAKNNLTLAKINKDKREIISPALIPDKNIYRYNAETNSDYYVYFSKDTVKKAAYLYLKNNNHHKATYQHEDRVAGVLTVESWIVEDPKKDKSALYGYNLPKGTWMVKMSITNEDLWSKVKSGDIKGLSIEGFFVDRMQELSEQKPTDHEILTALNEILNPNLEKIAKELSKTQDLEDYPWEQCIIDQSKAHSKEDAEKICGYIKSKYGN